MSVDTSNSIELKLKKIELLKAKKKLQDELPHLYGFRHYMWTRKFHEAMNKLVFLSAPNQVGKSSRGIIKAIDFCTNKAWWGKVSNRPRPILGFYLYPDLSVARREINSKWIPEFLPRGEMKDHPQYGWELIDKDKKALSIRFKSGVEIIFMGYSQGRSNILSMAASSPDFIFIDEEMPPQLWPEVSMRVEAVKGTIHFLATPVECYPLWRDIFNGKTKIDGALVLTVSMYHCLTFEDGSPGVYTKADIKAREAKLGSQAEIDKRVHGKYVTPEGILFPSFSRELNVAPKVDLTDYPFLYAGVDPGSGGTTGHPYGIALVAVNAEHTKGRVIRIKKGDTASKTTASDVLEDYLELIKGKIVTGAFYDWASADFGTLAQRAGVYFQKADKSRESGVSLLNSLFKNGALIIDDGPELEYGDVEALCTEFESLRASQTTKAHKHHAVDDLSEAVRYAITKIPWNIVVNENLKSKEEPKPISKASRYSRDPVGDKGTSMSDEIEDELNYWNELME